MIIPIHSGEIKGLMSILMFFFGMLLIAPIVFAVNAMTIILTVFGSIMILVGIIGFIVGIFSDDEYVNFDFLFDHKAIEEEKDGN